MNIKVIGSGCENCDKTNAIVKECVEELGIDAEIGRDCKTWSYGSAVCDD